MTTLTYPPHDRAQVPFITSYAEARLHFDSVAPIRGTDNHRPAGKRSMSNRRMREHADGSIGYLYFGDEVCVWHRNGDVTIMAPSDQRQSSFTALIMPRGIHVDIGTRAGPIAYLTSKQAGESGHDQWWFWSAWWGEKQEPTGDMVVINAEQPVRVRLDSEQRWRPVDESALEPFEWQTIAKGGRAALKTVDLSVLTVVSNAVTALEGEFPPYKGPGDGCRGRGDYEGALACLEADNVYGALTLLRRSHRWVHDGGSWVKGPIKLISTELERLRTLIYQREGATAAKTAQMLTLAEYLLFERARKRFQ